MSLFSGERETLGPTLWVADGTAPTLQVVPLSTTTPFDVTSETVSIPLFATMTAATDIVVVNTAIKITAIQVSVSVVSTSGTLNIRKITDTSAPSAAAGATVKEFLATPAFDLHTITLNTVLNQPLSVTASDLVVATGNRIAISMGGTLTGLVGQVTVTFVRV